MAIIKKELGVNVMRKYNVVIVGGGSTFTPGFLKSFCRCKKISLLIN